mgnify:CR=1 FL=1
MATSTPTRHTIAIIALLVTALSARAQYLCDFTAPSEMFAFDADFAHRFGAAIDADQETLIIGAPGAPEWGTQSGAAYAYRRTATGWQLVQKLVPNDGVPFDLFGSSIAVSGDYALIGAPGRDDNGENSGTVYIFHRSSGAWSQIDRLDPPEPVNADAFGAVIDLDGPHAIISLDNAAIAYYRLEDTWYLTAGLGPDDWPAPAEFASSIRVHGNLAIVGAPGQEIGALTDAGAAYIYEFDGSAWLFRTRLNAFTPDARDWFGSSVSIDQDIAVIGAPRDDAPGTSDTREDSGACFIFVRTATNAWAPTYLYRAPDAAPRDHFAAAPPLTPDAIIIGAPRDDTAVPSDRHDDAGSVYIYRRGPGHSALIQSKVYPHIPRRHANMGRVIAADAGFAFIGAPNDDALCSGQFLCESGSVSVIPGVTDCNDNAAIDACDIRTGAAPDLDADNFIDGCIPCRADTNSDARINVDDLNTVLTNWGQPDSGASNGDVTGDNQVGVDDLNQVLMEWGSACL